MNRYFAISGGLHVLAALFLLLILAPSAKKASATYTIDFIGSGKVVATTGQEASAPKAPKAAVQAPAVAKDAQPKAEPAKTAKKAYASKSEITAKKQSAKKAKPSAPLAAPSVLDESQAGGQSAESAEAAKEGQFAGGNIKNLQVERKSGDDTFDFAASSAVINAGPFAPLPMYYEKDELTVSVEFKQEK